MKCEYCNPSVILSSFWQRKKCIYWAKLNRQGLITNTKGQTTDLIKTPKTPYKFQAHVPHTLQVVCAATGPTKVAVSLLSRQYTGTSSARENDGYIWEQIQSKHTSLLSQIQTSASIIFSLSLSMQPGLEYIKLEGSQICKPWHQC